VIGIEIPKEKFMTGKKWFYVVNQANQITCHEEGSAEIKDPRNVLLDDPEKKESWYDQIRDACIPRMRKRNFRKALESVLSQAMCLWRTGANPVQGDKPLTFFVERATGRVILGVTDNKNEAASLYLHEVADEIEAITVEWNDVDGQVLDPRWDSSSGTLKTEFFGDFIEVKEYQVSVPEVLDSISGYYQTVTMLPFATHVTILEYLINEVLEIEYWKQ
jgi:hypothetical protein